MSLTAHLRALLHRTGGTMPKPPPLGLDEVRVTPSPGWNGPEMETSENYRGRGLNAFLPHYPDEEST